MTPEMLGQVVQATLAEGRMRLVSALLGNNAFLRSIVYASKPLTKAQSAELRGTAP